MLGLTVGCASATQPITTGQKQDNRWAVAMNVIGGSDRYAEASYEERRAIELAHEHWPPMIYIRMGRRMVSDYMMTEHD